jgi:hypothetical protein
MSESQISAFISDETKEKLERYAEAHGMKKGALVEQALLHHLQALHEMPRDIVIPPRIKLSEASFTKVARFVRKPRKPTKAMRKLVAGKLRGEPF